MEYAQQRKKYQYLCGTLIFIFIFLFIVYLINYKNNFWYSILIPLTFFCVSIIGTVIFTRYKLFVLFTMYRDSVTGEPNELSFQKDFESKISSGEPYGFYYINIKKFSLINSEYGRAKGDEILKKIYVALQSTLQEDELLARVNTDTYYALLKISSLEEAHRRLYQLDDSVYFLENLGIEQKIFLSVGIYLIQGTEDTFMNAVDCADFCRTNSADCKDNNTHYEIYDSTISDTRKRSEELLSMAHPALKHKDFKLFLQPKVELEHETPVEAEALIRWIDPQQGMIPLYQFIPLFEANGFMRQLDYFIFDSVLSLIEKWMDEGKTPLKISVNLSKSHFTEENFFKKKFIPIFNSHHVPKKYIEFEISESTLLDNEQTLIDFVHMLNKQNFTCSMDDFGSGYSSLNTLKNLPVSVLKLDKKIFSEDAKEKGKIVSKGIIRIAQELHMKIVAEGIETREYVDFLKSLHCDMVQGYYFGKPMSVCEFESYLNEKM